MEPQPYPPSIVPSVALIIKLPPATERSQNAEKSPILAAELCHLGLPATWVIDEAWQADCFARTQLATTKQEVALTAAARSPQRLRSELANRQAAVQAATGHVVSVIAGDPLQLRARTTILAELGIRGVVARSQLAALAKPPRLLPCGVWQLDSTVTLPQTRARWSLFPRRRLTAARLLTMGATGQPVTVEIDLGQLNTADLTNCQRLLQELDVAQRQQQLAVSTVSEVMAQLATQHQVRPQRSILRKAA